MTRRTRLTCRVFIAIATLVPLYGTLPFSWAQSARADAARISFIVSSPKDASLQFGVDALQEVVRTTDGGQSWTPVFEPGDAQAPDPSTPGACLPGNYDRVTFLAINPLQSQGLYVGTDGVVGDYLDNGCGNAPGGLYYSADGVNDFSSFNHGLPANSDARGGGPAWGVQSLIFDPRDKSVMYVVTDGSFLAIPGNAQSVNPIAPGIYRTVETGSQWDPAYAGISATACQFGPCRNPGSLAVVPDQSRVLLYASDTGFYRSENRGDSWRRTGALTFGARPRFLTRIDPFESQLVYVVTDTNLYRSSDGGLHVARILRADAPAAAGVTDLTFDSQTPPNVTFLLGNGRRVTVRDSGPAPGPEATLAPLSSPIATATIASRATATAAHPKASPTALPRSPPPTVARASATATTPPTPRPTPTAVATSAPAQYSAGAAWSMVGHDAGQSYADVEGSIVPAAVRTLHVRWSATGESPQIVADGTLYAIDAAGHVQARDAATGAVKYAYQSTNVQGVAYRAPLVYFNRSSEIRIVTASTADWSHSATGGSGDNPATFDSFVLSGNTIFTGAGPAPSGSVSRYFAFDAKTGKQLWQRSGTQSSVPCVVSNTLYLGFGALGAGDSYVLDANTGAIRRVLKHIGAAQWHAAGNVVYASVLSGGGSRLRASIHAYDWAGNTRWVAHDILFGAATPTILFGITTGAVDARSAVDGHRLWKTGIPGFQSVGIGSLVVSGGLVFVQSTDGRVNVLDRDSGRLLRTVKPPFSGAAAGNLIVGGGMLFESINRTAAGATTLIGFGS